MIEEPTDRPETVGRPVPLARLARKLLGVPLFLKILLANAVIAAVAGVAALAVAQWLTGGRVTGLVLVVSLVFVGATLVLGAMFNAAVIRLALSPLLALAATAERVRRGELSARVPDSPLADQATSRLIWVFNRMLDGVQAANERQQALALRVLQAEERERARIAHELYAGTAQTLAGVLVRLRVSGRLAAEGQEGHNGSSRLPDEIRQQVVHALDEIRAMARRLRPPELDELGVRPALEAHARSLSEGRDLSFRIKGHIPESQLSRDTALALFRVTQEAMTNAALHSGAQVVKVGFSSREAGLLAEVSDDGCGFDVRDLFTGTAPNLGVTGMRERAVYVGGTFSIDSVPDGGTRVRVLVPWKGSEPDAESHGSEAPLETAGEVRPAGVI